MNEVNMTNNQDISMQSCTINDVCRLCANFDENLISIYADEGADHMLENKIKTHLPFINISEDDLLPKGVCYHCASAVLVWNELYDCSSEADQKLRNMFELNPFDQNQCKVDIQDDERLNPTLKSEISDIMFDREVDNDSVDDNMYLNAAGLDDDINGLMNCHRLEDISVVDDCNLVVPKQEYLDVMGGNSNHVDVVDHQLSTEANVNSVCGGDDISNHNDCDDFKPLMDSINVNDTEDGEMDDLQKDGHGSNGINCEMDDENEDEDEDEDEDCNQLSNMQVRQLYLSSSLDGASLDEDEQQPETMCQICATVFKTRYNLLRHFQKRHPEFKMFECDLCRISFSSVKQFKNHLEEKHSKIHPTSTIDSKQVRFACDVCGNMYKNKASAMNHLLTHTAKKTVRCTHCDFTCYTKQQLGVHQTKHDKRFVCDICHKRFAQKSQLDVHVNAVHYNQRPFSCVLCNKTFKTKGSHDAHMIVHTDTRNYQCPHCDKKCRKRYDLTLHIRTHTGEKPFKCSVCGRGFVQMCDTRKHEMLHFKPGKRKNLLFESSEVGMADDE
ncbi:zinc finger protein 615-like isoform X2 [Metopolophium dirhodum]|uniref:zinc finger protein 615-like isoform X2 n=1 Tax=Metopolophium dirhodum TaxID=44670 RepID=UPI002990769E|nr:zinc finger protein 615-like isoform X2 [Metopolophium dirhodum]